MKRHRLVVETNTDNVQDGCQTRSCHESMRFNVGDETLRDRSEQPVVIHDDSSHEQTMLNEVNMDFRIPGLPHSVVTHAQSTSVRKLIQKNWRASLNRNSGQSKFHRIHIGPYNSRKRHQEGKTSRPQIWETSRIQRILPGQ